MYEDADPYDFYNYEEESDTETSEVEDTDLTRWEAEDSFLEAQYEDRYEPSYAFD